MTPFFLLAIAAWIVYLAAETLLLRRRRRRIPLLVTVTGTRGKTTVTRILASVFREDGRRVVAKATGSEPVLLLPDGTEEPLRRRGRPSILEQKSLVGRAVREGADVVVAEVMSLHAENHRVEAWTILRPDRTVVTNLRVDHPSAAGWTRKGVAEVLGWGVAPGSRVYIPAAEVEGPFAGRVEAAAAELVAVDPFPGPRGGGGRGGGMDAGTGPGSGAGGVSFSGFPENEALVRALCLDLDVDPAVVDRGMDGVGMDVGEAGIWELRSPGEGEAFFTVNAFAANDPESTEAILEMSEALMGGEVSEWAGLLVLRRDRGDRTVQWAEALLEGFLERFQRLHVVGFHAPALRRKVLRDMTSERRRAWTPRILVSSERDPASLTLEVAEGFRGEVGGIFGFGNIVGRGRELVRYWQEAGSPHEP